MKPISSLRGESLNLMTGPIILSTRTSISLKNSTQWSQIAKYKKPMRNLHLTPMTTGISTWNWQYQGETTQTHNTQRSRSSSETPMVSQLGQRTRTQSLSCSMKWNTRTVSKRHLRRITLPRTYSRK